MKNDSRKISEKDIVSYNRKIIKLWKENQNYSEAKLIPFLYYELYTDRVLFVGMNPSFSEKKIKYLIRQSGDAELVMHSKNIGSFYKFKNYETNKESLRKLALIRRKDNYNPETKDPYFKKFNELSEQYELCWECIDLFNVRHTNQNDLIKKFDDEFYKKQLEYNIELMGLLEPKVIIVVNAKSSKILLNEINKPLFSEKLGTYIYNIKGKDIPVFLSGMISGQRALDLESFERLKWHLRFVKKQSL